MGRTDGEIMLYRFIADFNFSSLLRSFLDLEYWFFYDQKLSFITGFKEPLTMRPGITILMTNRVGPGDMELIYRYAGENNKQNQVFIGALLNQGRWLNALSINDVQIEHLHG